MYWYEKTDKQKINYNKPICATSSCGNHTYLLVPSDENRSYRFRGYDWFNISTGKYNSCMNYKTVEEAIENYSNVRNCSITLDIEK